MKELLEQPRFRKLNQSHIAGAPILRELWDRFDYSLLLMQSGISKRSGVPPWLLCFIYVIGLVSNCSSVNQMASLASKDAILGLMFKTFNVAQYTMSRLFSAPYDWALFSRKRIARLQEDKDTAMQDGDCINLDDTHMAHPYAKKLPFLCWLFDSSSKTYSWCMNLVIIQAVLQNGLEYPLFYRFWTQTKDDSGLTKYDLAKKMFVQLRESATCRLWVAMDRRYCKREFMVFLQDNGFDWVTKAKRNTALYRKITVAGHKSSYIPVTGCQLINENFHLLIAKRTTGLTAIALPDIYMKLPFKSTGRRGQPVNKNQYVPIAAVVAARLKEDVETTASPDVTEESPATYKGAYLIISNRHDVPEKALDVYGKRWRIEVFFRMAKQDLAFGKCHSTSEEHQYAHMELLFTVESLLAYALWQVNKEKTSDESCTHVEMVSGFFKTRS